MRRRVQPGARPAANDHSANLERRVVAEFGVDPYAARQSSSLGRLNRLTLTGNGEPASIRYGAAGYEDHAQSFDDYEPIQLYDWEGGGTGAPLPLGPNKALPTASGKPPTASDRLREMLGE